MIDPIRDALSKDLFACSIPEVATYSDTEIELMGLPIHDGLGRVDYDFVYGNRVSVEITIYRMLEIFSMGYPIYLKNPDDAVTIYKTLEATLTPEFGNFGNSIHKRLVDDDLLREIDRFNQEIFSNNNIEIVKDQMKFGFGHSLGFGKVDVARGGMEETVIRNDPRPLTLGDRYAMYNAPQQEFNIKDVTRILNYREMNK